ncbi:MAG: prepilin-type N-terminal cleavage/methylation domain-containing protein [Planctomycetota bacterium]|jgi:prepilin-type N-terminal cleavage/methylation domain-containing protein
MNRRGVTLLELLLAIALLLALAGLVLPALFDRLTERAFESSAEIVRSQLLLARAHAQATGEPIEVLFETDPSRVAARRFDVGLVDLGPEGDARGEENLTDEPFEVTSLDDEQAPETLRVPEPWAERVLADGVWIADRSGLAEEGSGGFGAEAGFRAAGDDRIEIEGDETPRTIRLALFMPDGSAVLAEPVWIRDEHGRRGLLTVNHWTGLPSFERVMEVQEDLREEEEEPEPEEEAELDRLEREFAEPEPPEAAGDEEAGS